MSWWVGVIAYPGASQVLWGERISPGDLRAVLFWSAFVAVIALSSISTTKGMWSLRGYGV